MADVQVTISLPVLRQGSNPESGPTVIEHLQLMLNERGGFPIDRLRPSTDHRSTLSDDPLPLQMAAAVGTRLNG